VPGHGQQRYWWTERASPMRCDCDGTWQPRTSPARESEPQGKPIGVRAEEEGRSERHLVMRWRGVERPRNITPRASGQTSLWSFVPRELGQLLTERSQLTAVTTLTGALSTGPGAWHTRQWYAVHRTVRRLQARLVKAGQAGRWGQVRAWQHLLTHSCSGKARAVPRVTNNDGRKTPGVDGRVWATPAKKARALRELRQRGSRARPLRRVYIPKKDGTQRQRPLSIPTMDDRALQALSLLALEPIAETLGDPNS
jgi:RNA-directed DNA polymerase